MRTQIPLLTLLLCTGCQQPFGSDRHDLEGFRILALHTEPTGGIPGQWIQPKAHFVSNTALWSDQRIEQYWFWLDSEAPNALAAKTKEHAVAVGPGPNVMIPARNATLGLLAVHPDGTEQRAILTLPDAPVGTTELGTILSFQTSQRLSDLTVDDLDIQYRAEWDLVQSPTFSTEFFGRLELYIQDEEQLPYRVRWMATGPFGTFYETTATTTDWAPAHVTVDDDAVVVSDPLPEGPRTFAALVLDTDAPRTVRYQDVWVGAAKEGAWVNGRWYPHNSPITYTGLATVVFAPDDDTLNGMRIEQWTPLDAEERSEADPHGTAGLSCAVSVAGPFQHDWLTLNWCLRSEIVGYPLVVEIQ